MRVPARQFQGGDARPRRIGQHAPCRFGQDQTIFAAIPLLVAIHAIGHVRHAQSCHQGGTQHGIIAVQARHPIHEINGRFRQGRWGPAGHRHRSAQDQRHPLTQRQAQTLAPAIQPGQRPVQPAAVITGADAAGIQQILRIKMAAVAIGGGDGMHGQKLFLPPPFMQGPQGGVQAETAIQVQNPALLPRFRQGQRAAHRPVIRIGIGYDGPQPIHGPAQHDQDQAPIRPRRCQRQSRGRCGQQAGGAGGGDEMTTVQHHDHLR